MVKINTVSQSRRMACHCVLPTNEPCLIKSHYSQTCPEKNDLQTRQWQPNNGFHVTHWITVPLRNHLYLCQVHELHLNNFKYEVICFQSQNCCIVSGQNQTKECKLTQLLLKYTAVQQTKAQLPSLKKPKSQSSNKQETWNMTFGESSWWYIFPQMSWTTWPTVSSGRDFNFHEHIALIKYLALVMAFELKCIHDIKF